MVTLIVAILGFSLASDTNIYGGMDANIIQFSRYWEEVYETSRSAFRTSQGCLDMTFWKVVYDGKFEAAFSPTFSLRYRFRMVGDYDEEFAEHRFEPAMKVWKDLYAHLVISPAFRKRDDEAGFGLAWRHGSTNWLALYGVAEAFDHNFALKYVSDGPSNDPFRRIPLKLELDARGELDWARVRLYSELGTQANQYLVWPDSSWEEWNRFFDKSLAWGRLELRPLTGLWLGSRFSWCRSRSETRWPAQGQVIADTLTDLWFEPFISWYPRENLELRGEYRFWDTYRNTRNTHNTRDTDSLTYHRDWDILSTLVSWQPLPVLVVEGGYQYSCRYRYNYDTLISEPWSGRHTQSRILLNLELRLKSGMMFTIKEGLEMDLFPRDLFRSPHNHTYVSLLVPFKAFPWSRENPSGDE